MTQRRFVRSRFSRKRNAVFFSERSGMPYKLRDMVIEPGTGLRVHKNESDGKWNRVDMEKKPIIPPDTQRMEHVLPGHDFTDGAPESFFD